MRFALILCLSVIADWILGDPRNFPHPVRLIGNAVNFWRGIFFTGTDSYIGGLAVVVMTVITAGLSVCLALYISGGCVIVEVYLLYSALAWRDLKDETLPIFTALMNHDIDGARKNLALVVGRDTEDLTGAGIIRAVIETVAENSVDGVMSVIFFAALGWALCRDYGMCTAVWVFKSASTLDSMLGYESLGRFGSPSARLDDIMNFIPARLGGVIIILAGIFAGGGRNFRESLRVFMSGRLRHKSPNSAHGESAFAGVLGVRLGGGAFYGGKFEPRPWLNENANEPEISDIIRAWRLLDISCCIAAVTAVIFFPPF